jgi:AraC family transcriptional regulator
METGADNSWRARILRVLVHVQSHLDDDLALDDLARIANCSPYHFHRVFSGMVGEGVKEHVRRLRLERAAQRLRFTGQPIVQIALDAGYETHESFTRAFQAMFDEAPSDFRKTHRVVAHGPSAAGVHYAGTGTLDAFRPVTRDPPLTVRVESMAPLRVAFRRHVGAYADVGPIWGQLAFWAGRRGLIGLGTRFLGVVHDDPEVTAPARLRYDAAITVPERVKGEGEVATQIIEPGRYAVTCHRGSYETIGLTYARLCGEWLTQSGKEYRSAPAIEFYLNSPRDVPPDQLLTDIYLPLES